MDRSRKLFVSVGVCAGALCMIGSAPASAATFTVTNTNNAGSGSLRKAIADANVTVAPDVVSFNIPGSGVHTITPLTPLPQINRPLTINGASEPDFVDSPVVELNGSIAGAGAEGLRVGSTAGASVIRALAINRFDGDGVQLLGDGNSVAGSFIGTNSNGTAALPNGRDGVSLVAGSANNTIGGNAPANRNLLSGNERAGVFMGGAGIAGNHVRGNFIGVGATGATPIPNQIGVWVSGGASNNTIGGATAAAGNVISGNAGAGALIAGGGTQGNALEANTIGLDSTRTSAVPNAVGSLIGGGADDNTIGGTGAARNVISGNQADGVAIEGVGTAGNIVRGNWVGLNGSSSAVPNVNGVSIRDQAAGNSVTANVISGNVLQGALVVGEGTANNQLRNNKIGTDPTGAADRGNDIGVLIRGGATDTDVFDNVISGNDVRAVDLGGPGTEDNVVRGNLIGLNAAGTAALANPNGIFVHNAASGNLIGGTTAADRNVISGNLSRGIEISINAPTSNAVRGNYIGLNAAGTAAVPNNTGIILLAGATDTTIGGTAPGARNVISGNTSHGAFVGDSSTTGTQIQGNRIGTNAAGTGAVGNGGNGVHLAQSTTGAQVGGTTAAARNVISANVNGVVVTGSGSGHTVQGNFIGTNAAGTGALGNTFHGIAAAGNVHDNLIGGKAGGAGNRIANNGGNGILIGSDPAQAALGLGDPAGISNTALGNRVFANGGLAIDLGPNDGVTPNDPFDSDSGPNGLLNSPVIDQVLAGGGAVFVSGSLESLSSRDYRLEFFLDSAPDPSGHGEARVFLGARTVTIPSGSNTASFEFTFGANAAPGSAVSATATDLLTNNTSELGPNAIVD